MLLSRKPDRRRGGATTVETAVTISVFLLFLFGLFEYCRFIFFMQVSTNAARDAARYAVVNMDKPLNFDYVNTVHGGVTFLSIKNYTDYRLSTNDKMLENYTVEIFPCDNAQLALSTPVVARKPVAAAPGAPTNPTSPYTSHLAWNVASFGERIAVRITGTYRPVLPNFLMMQTTYQMNIVATANSEG